MTRPRDCVVCTAYRRRRIDNGMLDPHLRLQAAIRGVALDVVVTEYLHGVHRRHVAGGCLSTRTHTPTLHRPDGSKAVRAQRVCNGCQKSLGDATTAELDAAVAGGPLPDVRLECGCLPQNGAAA